MEHRTRSMQRPHIALVKSALLEPLWFAAKMTGHGGIPKYEETTRRQLCAQRHPPVPRRSLRASSNGANPLESKVMYSRQELAAGFRALGIAPGDTLMVHASVRAVGEIAGGPDQIHLALKDALTEDGTLMMYASCPEYYDEVGRGHLRPEQERELLEKLPSFAAATARSARDNGTLVEFFRTSPGSTVNPHVARFVVWGRQAELLISRQPWDYAFGRESALDRFVQLGGKILLIGCDHDTVTFLHYAEHVVEIPDKRVARFKVPVDEDGQSIWRDMEEYDTSDRGAHPNWPDRFFARLVDTYLERTANAGARVGDALCFVLDSRALLDFTLDAMRAVAADSRAAEGLQSSSQPSATQQRLSGT
jgi:aminoglycoside 3-N-acetyltransferase